LAAVSAWPGAAERLERRLARYAAYKTASRPASSPSQRCAAKENLPALERVPAIG
jgi:hypothetical protein